MIKNSNDKRMILKIKLLTAILIFMITLANWGILFLLKGVFFVVFLFLALYNLLTTVSAFKDYYTFKTQVKKDDR